MKLLDLFCGAGGAAMGYHRAGFDEIVGVDIEPQPNYPFEFVQADAMTYPLADFDLIHASPPCQAFTKYKNARPDLSTRYPDLIAPIRKRLLRDAGGVWVIENVVGSPLKDYVTLCGSMFGLDVRRHRLFESSVLLLTPDCDHTIWPPNRFPGGRSRERGNARVLCRNTVEVGRWNITLDTQNRAMGIDWMTLKELSQAVPPAYTEWIGKQILARLYSPQVVESR